MNAFDLDQVVLLPNAVKGEKFAGGTGMNRRIPWGLFAVLAMSAAASAQTVPADGGRLLASNCFQCHGTNGMSGGFDALAGDSASDTYNKLREMKTKPPGSNIMIPHARGYTDAELLAIATYFSKLPKP